MVIKKYRIFDVLSRVDKLSFYHPFYKAVTDHCFKTEMLEYTMHSFTYDNLGVSWYYPNRKEPLIPYEEVIKDYELRKNEDHIDFAESCIDEAFSEEEAKALMLLLNKNPNIRAEIKEMDLPIEEIWVPPSMISTVGDIYEVEVSRSYDPNKDKCGSFTTHWTLPLYISNPPFEVVGYFSLEEVASSGAILKEHKKEMVTNPKKLEDLAREYEREIPIGIREWNF